MSEKTTEDLCNRIESMERTLWRLCRNNGALARELEHSNNAFAGALRVSDIMEFAEEGFEVTITPGTPGDSEPGDGATMKLKLPETAAGAIVVMSNENGTTASEIDRNAKEIMDRLRKFKEENPDHVESGA